MSTTAGSSDDTLIDILRRSDGMRVSALAEAMDVTATAIRQRLSRLTEKGFIERRSVRTERGRPHHAYFLTELGRRQTGSNFTDLAIALWEEIRQIADPEIRRGLMTRLSGRMAELYSEKVAGNTPQQRMESLADLFAQREIPFVVEKPASEDGRPVLKALGCPYTELAEQDRSICSMERMLFSQIVGERLRLSECRLDGQSCCSFELTQLN